MSEHDHHGHRKRMRERFYKTGLEGFMPHEILEMLLFFSISRGDTNKIAHKLIEKFGCLSAVLEAPIEELKKVEGIGEVSASLISFIPHITKAYMDDKNSDGVVLIETEEIGKFILPKFIGKNNETVLIVCMDKKRKVITSRFLSEGTLDAVNINIREIAALCMNVSATQIIIAHNHTQGFALPSPSDYYATEKIVEALIPLSIEVVDHLIVAREDYVSLKDSGFFAIK